MAKSQSSKYYKWEVQHKTITKYVRNYSAKNPKKNQALNSAF